MGLCRWSCVDIVREAEALPHILPTPTISMPPALFVRPLSPIGAAPVHPTLLSPAVVEAVPFFVERGDDGRDTGIEGRCCEGWACVVGRVWISCARLRRTEPGGWEGRAGAWVRGERWGC